MNPSPLDELAFLTQALRAHVQWVQDCGGTGLPACDETWLQVRREHYRNTPYLGPAESTEPSTVDGQSNVSPRTHDEAAPRDALASSFPSAASDASSAASLSPGSKDRLEGSDLAETVSPARAPRAEASPVVSPSYPATNVAVSPSPQQVAHLVANVSGQTLTPPNSPAPELVDAPPLSVEERRHRLTLLDEQVRQCRACGLCEERTNTVFARGDGSVGVAFVGEGPGADEDAQGYPFVGAAGQLLDKMIAAMGLARESVYVCNIVKCRPPKNRKPTDEEIAACRHYVVSQLELVQPRVIVALGATAVDGLLGVKLGITRLRGTWRLYKGTIPVMPTFHPAYLLRQPDAKRQVWEDLQAVLTRLNMPIPQRGRR
jgi:uracil-DNA glycosylase family 4